MIVWCVFVWCGILECVLVVVAPQALFVVCMRVCSCGYMHMHIHIYIYIYIYIYIFGSINVVVVVGARGVRPWVQQCGGTV